MSSNMSILAFLPFSACTQMCPFHDHVDFIPALFLVRFISLMFIVVTSSLIPFPSPFSFRRLVRIFWQWSRRKKRAIIVGGFPSRLRPIRWTASESWARRLVNLSQDFPLKALSPHLYSSHLLWQVRMP